MISEENLSLIATNLLSHRSASVSVWMQLQDIHEALGLRYQWGGSHCNKVLLCSLGIDTRNIVSPCCTCE